MNRHAILSGVALAINLCPTTVTALGADSSLSFHQASGELTKPAIEKFEPHLPTGYTIAAAESCIAKLPDADFNYLFPEDSPASKTTVGVYARAATSGGTKCTQLVSKQGSKYEGCSVESLMDETEGSNTTWARLKFGPNREFHALGVKEGRRGMLELKVSYDESGGHETSISGYGGGASASKPPSYKSLEEARDQGALSSEGYGAINAWISYGTRAVCPIVSDEVRAQLRQRRLPDALEAK